MNSSVKLGAKWRSYLKAKLKKACSVNHQSLEYPHQMDYLLVGWQEGLGLIVVGSDFHCWMQTWAKKWTWFRCFSAQAICHPRVACRSVWKCKGFGNGRSDQTTNLSRGGSQGLDPSPKLLAVSSLRCSSGRCRRLRKVVHTLTLLQADCLRFNRSSSHLLKVRWVYQSWNWVWFWGLWASLASCGR